MNSSLMLYDAFLVAAIAISRNVAREKAPSEVYPGELSSVPDLLCGGRNCSRGRAETVSFVRNTSAIGRLDSRPPALTQSHKEVHGHGDADGDHNPTDLLRIDSLHVVRTEPAPDEGTRHHHGALRPQHGAG